MKVYKTSEDQRRKARERMRMKRRAKGIPEKKSFDERFWGRVEPVTESGCWLWTGSVVHSGHGRVSVDGVIKRAHRVSWEQANGPIPDGMCVLHECDVPSCVNPDHLFLGDQSANMEDMHKKGRAAVGERHWNAKLTKKDVIQIRADSRPLPEIAKEYGVGVSTVCWIKAGKAWSHISGAEAA